MGKTCLKHLQRNVKKHDDCSQDEPSHPAESRSLCQLIPLLKERIGLHTDGNKPAAILNHSLQEYQYLNRSLHPLIFCYFSPKRCKAFTVCWIEMTASLRRFTGLHKLMLALVFFLLLVVLHPSAHPPGQGRGIEGWGFGGSTDIRALL